MEHTPDRLARSIHDLLTVMGGTFLSHASGRMPDYMEPRALIAEFAPLTKDAWSRTYFDMPSTAKVRYFAYFSPIFRTAS